MPGQHSRDAETLFKDWAVRVYLDDEGSDRFDINAFDFGNPSTTPWTIALANDEFFGGRDVYQGAVPQAKYENRVKRGKTGTTSALPFGTSYQTYRNPGSRFSVNLDGDDQTRVAPHSEAGPPVRGVQEPVRLDPGDRDGRRHARLLELELHRGGLGLRLRRGPGRRRLGHRAAEG